MKKSMESAYTDMMNNLAKSTAAIPLHLQGAKDALAWWEHPDSLLAKSAIAPTEEATELAKSHTPEQRKDAMKKIFADKKVSKDEQAELEDMQEDKDEEDKDGEDVKKSSAENETDEAYEEDEKKDAEKEKSEKEEPEEEDGEEEGDSEEPEEAPEGMKKAMADLDEVASAMLSKSMTVGTMAGLAAIAAPVVALGASAVRGVLKERREKKAYNQQVAADIAADNKAGVVHQGPLAKIKAENERKAAMVTEAAGVLRNMNQTYRTKVLGKALADLDKLATDMLNKADSYLPGQIEMFGDAPPPPKKTPAKKGKKNPPAMPNPTDASTPMAKSSAAEASALVHQAWQAYRDNH